MQISLEQFLVNEKACNHAHDILTRPIRIDFGTFFRRLVSLEATAKPMNRDFGVHWTRLGSPEASAGPMNRHCDGSGESTGTMNRDFGAPWGLLGSSDARTGPTDRDLRCF